MIMSVHGKHIAIGSGSQTVLAQKEIVLAEMGWLTKQLVERMVMEYIEENDIETHFMMAFLY